MFKYILVLLVAICTLSLWLLFNNSTDENIPKKAPELVQIEYSVLKKYTPLFRNKVEVEVFVSPTGNDSAQGTKEKPLATAQKARDILRMIRVVNKQRNKKYTVTFLEGTYSFKSSLTLDSSDSGTVDYPILYRGEEGKKVVFSGGYKVGDKSLKKVSTNSPHWSKLDSASRKNIWIINLREEGIVDYGNIAMGGYEKALPSPMELFVDGSPQTLARWPNADYARVNDVQDSVTFFCYQKDFSKWNKETDIWSKGFWKYGWADFNLPIDVKSPNKNLVKFKVAEKKYGMAKKNQWFAFNLLTELDTLGEYYVDRKLGLLYFIPQPNRDIKKMNIYVSVFGNDTSSFITINNSSNIIIENITFQYTRSAGITVSKSNNIIINNCSISNVGSYAITLEGYNCKLTNLKIANTGAYGVKIKGGDRKRLLRGNNIISNSVIHDLGRINYMISSCGVSLEGVGNTVKNCEIYNLPHMAVFFDGNYHLIEKNKIHDVCKEADDAGAIYCGRDWALRGNEIKYNFIYNIEGSSFKKRSKKNGIHGVYIDDYASGILVYGNVFYNINNSGVVNSAGRDNIIENNIFVGCKYAHRVFYGQHLDIHKAQMYSYLDSFNYRQSPWCDSFPELLKISKTKSYWIDLLKVEEIQKNYSGVFRYFGIKISHDRNPEGCRFSDNIIYNCKKMFVQYKNKEESPYRYYTIKNNSIDVNPCFINEGMLNFNLSDNSPIYCVPGFNRIPFETIGVLN